MHALPKLVIAAIVSLVVSIATVNMCSDSRSDHPHKLLLVETPPVFICNGIVYANELGHQISWNTKSNVLIFLVGVPTISFLLTIILLGTTIFPKPAKIAARTTRSNPENQDYNLFFGEQQSLSRVYIPNGIGGEGTPNHMATFSQPPMPGRKREDQPTVS